LPHHIETQVKAIPHARAVAIDSIAGHLSRPKPEPCRTPDQAREVKTIFLCQYLQSEALRREVNEGLNVVEQWNSANAFIFFARRGEMASNRREDHEISMLALHLLQNCMVYINDPPEYIVPQLLTRWLARKEDYLGIRYFTSKDDPSTNSNDWSINLVLPARSNRPSGYCEYLAKKTRFTNPQELSAMEKIPLNELVTRTAGDQRQLASGRYNLRWPDGRIEEYIGTVFGKMEYWLDRTDLELRSVSNH
jgi:hypothetical protein